MYEDSYTAICNHCGDCWEVVQDGIEFPPLEKDGKQYCSEVCEKQA